jgi:hypothetical protein
VKTALLTTDLCVKVSGDETPLKIQEKYTFPCTVGSLTRAYLISSRRNSILSDMSARAETVGTAASPDEWNGFNRLFVHSDTLACVQDNLCIPCLYKIFPDGGKCLHQRWQELFPQNVRPELCPRFGTAAYDDSSYRGLYDRKTRLLTLGDGDFSFSLSLMSPTRKATRLTATSYESYQSISEAYLTGVSNIEQLSSLGVQVINGVDATELSACAELNEKKFDIAIWNFPCIGLRSAKTEDGQVKELELNKQLLRDFFLCVGPYLRSGGYNEIHITHKTTEPFSWWNIEQIATDCGLICEGTCVFDRYLFNLRIESRL